MGVEKIKILHLIDSGGLYGAEKMLLTLVCEQIKRGIQPMILSAGEPGTGEKPLETEAIRLGLPVTKWRMRPGFNFFEACRILFWAKNNGYRLLHSHGYKFNILIGLLPRRIRGIPIISTVHGYVKARFPKKIWFYELLDRLALRSVDHVVFVRKGMEMDIGHFQRTSVIVNGIPLEQETHPASLSNDIQNFISSHQKLVVAVGRLSKEKGFDVLVNAFGMLADSHSGVGLLIAGEGPEKKRIKQLIDDLGLDANVTMPGYLSNIPTLLYEADVMVIPSYTEGLPMVLLEAIKAECPVVATSVGGVPEVLDYGRAGYLIPRGDSDALFQRLTQVLECDDQAEQKVSHALDRLARLYSAGTMALSYNDLYIKTLISKREH